MAMDNRAIKPAAGATSRRLYNVLWLTVGACGIFYITIATLAPELLRGLDAASGIDATNAQVAALGTNVTQINGQIASLQDKQKGLAADLGTVRNTVVGLQTQVASIEALDKSITGRLSALDGGMPVSPDVKAPGSAPPVTPAPEAIDNRPATGAMPQIDGVVVPADPSTADGASDTPPAKKPVKAADTKPKSYAVDLVAVSTSNQALSELWGVIKDQHPELMAGLTPRAVTSGANVRLLAGPFASQAAAAAACAKFRAKGVACTPTPMAGTPL